jgi:glycosyltransferase involved in cell wall biosynthesis
MRIAISGMFWDQPTVGSGQYLRGMLHELLRSAPQHEYVLLLPGYRLDQQPPISSRQSPPTEEQLAIGDGRLGANDSQSPIATPKSLDRSVVVRTPFDRRSENLAKLWYEQVGVPLAAARLGADLLHVPYFAPPLWAPMPVVATVLDIIPLRLPEYRGGAAVRAYMRLVARAARRAANVIAISEASRRDIILHLGCRPQQVTTIPLAAGPQDRPRNRQQAAELVAARYGLHEPFVYYVGGLDVRKNVATLLRAWQWLRRAGGPMATLVIAGRALGTDPRLFPDLDALIESLGVRESVVRIDVPHADNPLLYNAATAFAYPSCYEGFGLPPLEAMACGTPTVVAAASSLPEVVGNAALLVPPYDLAGWVAALWRLLADRTLREDLRRRGFERAAQFSYQRVARETVAAYGHVVESRQTAGGEYS